MTLRTLTISAAACALMAGGAIAQTTAPEASTATGAAATATTGVAGQAEFTSLSDMTVGDLIGQNVYSPDGDTIGDIDYVIGQPGDASAVIGIGGFLGIGEYTVALPLDDFGYDSAQQMVTLGTSKDALKEQPEFDESNVESLPDETPLADLMADDDMDADNAMSDDSAASDDKAMSDDSAASGDSAMSDDGATTDDSATADDNAMSDDSRAAGEDNDGDEISKGEEIIDEDEASE